MRDIEFKGKVINNVHLIGKANIGDWVHGNLIVTDNGDAFITTWKTKNSEYEKITYRVDPGSVGQYTGLHDKNDKKIYEGDLFYYHDVLRKVVYREDNAAWMGIVVKFNTGKCNLYLKNIDRDNKNRLLIKLI